MSSAIDWQTAVKANTAPWSSAQVKQETIFLKIITGSVDKHPTKIPVDKTLNLKRLFL